MDKKLSIKAIRDLLNKLRSEDRMTRLHVYGAIVSMMIRINECYGAGTPNLENYTGELLEHCEAIAGLDDGNGHDESQHFRWALSAIQKLESCHCLNVDQLQSTG